MNHYKWLQENFSAFTSKIGLGNDLDGLISAHGDKCYGYKGRFEEAGIPFPHGVALYLIGYVRPWSKEVRKTDGGWVCPCQWIIDNYHRFESVLASVN